MTGLERLLAAMRDAAEVGAAAVSRWGHTKQLAKAREEAAEYSLELARLADAGVLTDGLRARVLEEAADVIITAMQVGGMLDLGDGFNLHDIAERIEEKSFRLRRRIEAAKEGGR